jgi:hypothetical protein
MLCSADPDPGGVDEKEHPLVKVHQRDLVVVCRAKVCEITIFDAFDVLFLLLLRFAKQPGVISERRSR